MTRSIGEAAATGLDAGLQLGLGLANQRRQQARQDTLDAQAAEDRQRTITRQSNADTLGALNQQEQQLAQEGQAMTNADTPPTPAQQADFTQRVTGLRKAKDEHLSKISGFVTDTKKAADADLATLNTGDVGKVQNLTRAVTVATGQNPQVYLRQGDQPSPIEQAGQAMLDGIQNGDQQKVVAGANVLFAPKLNVGLGEASPHGGKIVKKEIIGVTPAPGGDPADPKFIPTLRVYVRKDGFMGPGDPDLNGATGHYDAPLTEGRSSSPDAKVKALGLKDVMDFVGHNLHVAELLNQPEGLAKLQQDQQAADQFDPQQYLGALAQVGVSPTPKTIVKETVIPAGGTLNRTVTNARTGAVISQSSTQGNAKVNPADKLTIFSDGIDKQVEQGVMSEEEGSQLKSDFAQRQARGSGDATMENKLRQIDEDDSLSAEQKAEQRKAVLSGIKPGKPGGSAASADPRAADRKLGRQLQVVKDQRIELDNSRKHALEEFKAATHDANKKDAAAAKVIYDAKIKALEAQDTDLKSRLKKINDQLDASDDAAAAPAPATAPETTPRGLGASRDGATPGKVAPADQRARDTDRVRILADEMDSEKTKLARLQSTGTDPAAIERTRGNIAALQRETDTTRRGLGQSRPASGAASSPAARPGAVLKFDKNGNRVSS